MRISPETVQAIWETRFGDRAVGHPHFWERALTRRAFLGTTAAAAGAAMTPGAWMPAFADDDHGHGTPKPVPAGGIGGDFRVYLPGPHNEPSTITDFSGTIGIADIDGVGTGTDPGSLTFGSDMRFMSGTFVGTDGRRHHGTFGFV